MGANLRKFWVASSGALATILETGFHAHVGPVWPSVTVAVTAVLVYLVPNVTTKTPPPPAGPPPAGVKYTP
jgi:hypothetical protein